MKFTKAMQIKGVINRPSIKTLDDLCRKVVQQRDKMTCRRCARTKDQGYQMQWSHFYSRSNKSVRWDLDNSMLLCGDCHMNFAHKQPKEFAEFWEKTIGEKAITALRFRACNKAGDYGLIKMYLDQELRTILKKEGE